MSATETVDTAMTKAFPTTAVATMSTGVVLGKFSEATELAEWIMGHPIWTHQLPALADQISAAILKQFPDMPTELPGCDKSNWEQHARALVERFGPTLTVQRGNGQTAMHPLDGLPDKFYQNSAAP